MTSKFSNGAGAIPESTGTPSASQKSGQRKSDPPSGNAGKNDTVHSVCHYDRAGVFIRFEYASEEFPEDDSYVRGAITISEQKLEGGRRTQVTLSWAPRQEDDDWLMINSFISGGSSQATSPNVAPASNVCFSKENQKSTIVLGSHSVNAGNKINSKQHSKATFSIDVESIKEMRKVNPGMGWPILAIFGEDKTQPLTPLLEFLNGGVKELFVVLKKFMSIKKSKVEENTWILHPRGQDWNQSLHALNISWNDSTYIAGVHSNSSGVYANTVDGLSKVKNYVFDSLLHQNKIKKGVRPPNECVGADEDVADGLLSASAVGGPAHKPPTQRFGINNKFEPGYDMITCVSVGERPVLKSERDSPIDEIEYSQMIDSLGVIMDKEAFLKRVFKGGISETMRPVLWKYLLGFYSFSKTLEENLLHAKQKKDEYFRMKLQWKTFSKEQFQNFCQLREKKALIEKDVLRTDRSDDFFRGSLSTNENLCKLYDILMTYCIYNFDLGYLQGMSDLLAPLLMVLEDEVQTFWCFVGFMRMTCTNFDMDDEKGMKLQFSQLKYLLNLLDPSFYAFLESKESGNLFFCFRWLLVWFKREFTFHDICSLWEVLWTGVPCSHFHLFVCVSMLDLEKTTIMGRDLEFTEILKHVNEMALRMRYAKVLKNAEAIFLQVKAVEANLPEHMKAILVPNYTPSSIVDRQHLGDFSGLVQQSLAGEDEYGDPLGGDMDGVVGVDPVGLLTADFSEMYKSVNFTSPSLIVPPLEDDGSELTL